MKALAQFVMRGPVQAAGVAALMAALPLLFWVSAAIVALVMLRVSLAAGLNVALWALLPALGWALVGQDPTALGVLAGTTVMAAFLRQTLSWERALLAGAAVLLLFGMAVPVILPALFEELVRVGADVLRQFDPQNVQLGEADLEAVARDIMLASLAASQFAIAIASLMLARSWQARLFNPGGFQREFHAFRLSWPVSAALVALVLLLPLLGLSSLLVAAVLGTPLVLAGIALVHGLIGKKGLSGAWLVGFYVFLLISGPSLLILLVLIAIFDSWIDIRARVRPKNG